MLKKTFAVVVGAAAAAFIVVACTDDSPTIPTPAPPTVTFDPSVNQGVVVGAPTVVASPSPAPELPLWVSCDANTGICTFGTDKPRLVDAKCTIPGENPPTYGTWSAVVNDGDTVDVRDICHKIEAEDCAPKTVPVQVDFHGMGRHIGHLGPLYNLTFPQKLSPEECEECVEWKEPKTSTSCGDWNECHEHLLAVTAPSCFQEKECIETTEWNCKDPETRELEETQPCECECVEWDEPEITRERDPGEWSACEPRLTASTGGGGAECKRWREVVLTVTRTWNCKDPEIKTETKRESEACDCPTDPDLCHISNQGAPGDTNFNLIITPAAGHAHHSIPNGFCPGDLLANNCTCDAALTAAESCGDPAAGGFRCRDNRN